LYPPHLPKHLAVVTFQGFFRSPYLALLCLALLCLFYLANANANANANALD
jgi:hypothetical protein